MLFAVPNQSRVRCEPLNPWSFYFIPYISWLVFRSVPRSAVMRQQQWISRGCRPFSAGLQTVDIVTDTGGHASLAQCFHTAKHSLARRHTYTCNSANRRGCPHIDMEMQNTVLIDSGMVKCQSWSYKRSLWKSVVLELMIVPKLATACAFVHSCVCSE